MTTREVTTIVREMLLMYSYLGGPIILAGMVMGLLVGVFQTVTQVQEQAVNFVIKIAATAAVLLFLSPWMITKLIDFSSNILGNLDRFIR
ncbi:MAG: flagellar biosynthetic protein FliQ [Vulcanimicrobiota bacterium]